MVQHQSPLDCSAAVPTLLEELADLRSFAKRLFHKGTKQPVCN